MANKTAKIDFAPLFRRVVLRFIRTFMAGGLAAIAMQVANAPTLATLTDFKMWGISLATGFVVGGILALDKMYRG